MSIAIAAIPIDRLRLGEYISPINPQGAVSKEKVMALGVFGSLVALVSLGGLVLLVLALIDLVKRPAGEWTATLRVADDGIDGETIDPRTGTFECQRSDTDEVRITVLRQ